MYVSATRRIERKRVANSRLVFVSNKIDISYIGDHITLKRIQKKQKRKIVWQI